MTCHFHQVSSGIGDPKELLGLTEIKIALSQLALGNSCAR